MLQCSIPIHLSSVPVKLMVDQLIIHHNIIRQTKLIDNKSKAKITKKLRLYY